MSLLFIMPSFLGDALFATGLLDYALTEWKPRSCTIVTSPLTLGLFEDTQESYGIEVTRISLAKRSYHLHWFDLWKSVSSSKWSYVVDLRGSPLSPFLFPKKLVQWRGRGKTPTVYEAMGKLVGLPELGPRLHLTTTRKMRAAQFFQSKGLGSGTRCLSIGPFSNWFPKDWPLDRYIEVCKALSNRFSTFLILGRKDQEERAEPLLHALGSHALPLFEVPSLLDVAALIAQSEGLLGGDSGLLHLAAAVGRPTIGLYGPSNEIFYGAWKGNPVRAPEPYQILLARGKETGGCMMKSITTEAVIDQAQKIWPLSTING